MGGGISVRRAPGSQRSGPRIDSPRTEGLEETSMAMDKAPSATTPLSLFSARVNHDLLGACTRAFGVWALKVCLGVERGTGMPSLSQPFIHWYLHTGSHSLEVQLPENVCRLVPSSVGRRDDSRSCRRLCGAGVGRG